MYHHESGAAKRRKTNYRKKRTDLVLAKTRKLTTWLQKRGSDTESLVTDEMEIRIQDEENTQDLARQSEHNATIDNSSSCEETDEIGEQRPSAMQIFSDDLGLWSMIVTSGMREYCQSCALRAKLCKALTSRM